MGSWGCSLVDLSYMSRTMARLAILCYVLKGRTIWIGR